MLTGPTKGRPPSKGPLMSPTDNISHWAPRRIIRGDYEWSLIGRAPQGGWHWFFFSFLFNIGNVEYVDSEWMGG